jgi:hypothetical protein
MHTLAKAYKKKHPNAKYSTALKEAGKKVRGKVSGHKAAKKSGKKKVGSHYVVHHTVKKVGAMDMPMPSPAQIEKQLNERLAWELLARESAKNATARKAAAKAIKATKGALKAISGLKRK